MKHRLIIALISLIPAFVCYAANEEMYDIVQPADTVKNTAVEKNKGSDYVASFHRNIFAEFGGPSMGIIGLGFDSRFKKGLIFGYRVGIAFANGSFDDNMENKHLDFKGVNFPLEVNAIMGWRKSKFEVGLGCVPSILDRNLKKYHYQVIIDDNGDTWINSQCKENKGTRINITGVLNIGYRYQRNSGFFMRAGLSFLMGGLNFSPIDGIMFMPNIAFGYTLP